MNIIEQIEEILNAESCYPEFDRKTYNERKADLINWYEKYEEVNKYYNIYGLDRKESCPNDEYLDRGIFRKQRHDINSKWYPAGSSFPYDYTIIMRDKYTFEMYMRNIYGREKKYCASLAVLQGTHFYVRKGEGLFETEPSLFFINHVGEKLVVKKTFGCSGDDVYIIDVNENGIYDNVRKIMMPYDNYIHSLADKKASFIIQDYINQHRILTKFNPSSVNTMRVVTFNTGKRVVFGKATFRYGRQGSFVDNADKGGYIRGITQEGVLKNDFFSFAEMKRHVDESITEVHIPFYKEAIELVLNTHQTIPGLFTVGWDIAFTEEGPILIEGNDGWDPYTLQCPMGNAMRSLYNRLLNERELFYSI